MRGCKMPYRIHLLDLTPEITSKIACTHAPRFDVLRLLAQANKSLREKLRPEIRKALQEIVRNDKIAQKLATLIRGKFFGLHDWTNLHVEAVVVSQRVKNYHVYGISPVDVGGTLVATVEPATDEPRTTTVIAQFIEVQDRFNSTQLRAQVNRVRFTINANAEDRTTTSGMVVFNTNEPEAYGEGAMKYLDKVLYLFE